MPWSGYTGSADALEVRFNDPAWNAPVVLPLGMFQVCCLHHTSTPHQWHRCVSHATCPRDRPCLSRSQASRNAYRPVVLTRTTGANHSLSATYRTYWRQVIAVAGPADLARLPTSSFFPSDEVAYEEAEPRRSHE